MTITIRLFQERGPLTSGRGTIIEEVNNISWRSVSESETIVYDRSPIRRPIGDPVVFSAINFHFWRVDGIHNGIILPRIRFSGLPSLPGFKVRLFARLRNTYNTPANGGISVIPGLTLQEGAELLPRISYVGPHTNTFHPTIIPPNQTFFTQWLETRLGVYRNDETNPLRDEAPVFSNGNIAFGNIPSVKIHFDFVELEAGGIL